MDEMLDFIENLSLDEQLYWDIPSCSSELRIEVVWKKSHKERPWRVRPKGTVVWTELNREDLVEKLESWGGDTRQFERSVGASIMTQAVFADHVIEGAAKLFGREAVDSNLEEARSFLSKIADTIKEQTKKVEDKKSLTRLRVVPSQSEAEQNV